MEKLYILCYGEASLATSRFGPSKPHDDIGIERRDRLRDEMDTPGAIRSPARYDVVESRGIRSFAKREVQITLAIGSEQI